MTDKIDDLLVLKNWLSKNPHLPQNIDDSLLLRFLHTCNYSLEQSKKLIDLFFTIRHQAPEIFDSRDPTDESIQNVLKVTDMVPLPKLTDKKYKVFVYRLTSSDADAHSFINSVKTFFMLADARMAKDKELPEGEVPIFDMANYTLKHMTKVQLPVLKKYMLYTQEAHPVKLREIHVINVPPYLDRLMSLVRPLIKPEVAKMIHFHQVNSTTLFNFIPPELLPEEYGGTVAKISDLKKEWEQNLLNQRAYLMDPSRWKVDESKRPANNDHHGKQLFGLEGTFRTLSID